MKRSAGALWSPALSWTPSPSPGLRPPSPGRERDLDSRAANHREIQEPLPTARSFSLREKVWSLDTIESSEGRQNEGLRGEGLNGEGDRGFVAELETEVGEEVQDRGTGRVF